MTAGKLMRSNSVLRNLPMKALPCLQGPTNVSGLNSQSELAEDSQSTSRVRKPSQLWAVSMP